ncbi:MAG: HAMP domain-containing sensor histidine kinase [Sulfurovaceae bacterium]|nr:HAMP domain-containing sensor histidine kinase [Sulfurovaceae bacterium]MDD5548424.1 HAMP domain-containing sensor histidine kinase [Sulfurovaceae bacterium]
MFKEIKKEIIIAVITLEILLILLWMAPYFFGKYYGFDNLSFFVSLGLMVIVSTGFVYILVSYLLESKYKIEKNLLHITDEIIHELNIPLTTITANSKMLSRNLSSPKDITRAERIEHASSRLKRLYETLVYNIIKEIQPIKKEKFYADIIVKECCEPFIDQDRNEFIFELENVELIADKIGFEQMIENIVSNAMKYSPKDEPITIKIANNVIEIIDRGMGMDDTQIIKIYDRYYQGDVENDGKGIGLAIVKDYCNKEGISITINSKKNQGTRVILDISKIII